MADEILLNEAAYAVWQTVKERGQIELGEVAKLTGIDQAQVSAAAMEAQRSGFFNITEREYEELVPGERLGEFQNVDLPERRAAAWLVAANGPVPSGELTAWANASGVQLSDVFKYGKDWIKKEGSKGNQTFSATPAAVEAINNSVFREYERVIREDLPNGPVSFEVLKKKGYDAAQIGQNFGNRTELAKIKSRVERVLSITNKGNEALKSRVKKVIERNTLTPEDLESDAWREIKLRPYDVTLAARDVYPAKIHPLRKIIEQTRRAFLEMGFAEVVSPMVESAFWNFDALFQPQDHPAREMQDTFYMRHPAEVPLPGEQKGVRTLFDADPTSSKSSDDVKKSPDPFLLVERVRRTHEDGWETGSEGWGYTWSPERSRQVVLRTHTTAATIRALAHHPEPPGKFFCVGWTYRNETISFKHLPVFHQVDGIIIDEEANLASLMGTLQEFYSKMGFGRVKFKPAFYPYTEPSVDVVVYMESRGKWLEMGGAGIFRPEVTLPLGCKQPVLAWGLGIERLAMLRFGLSDIRELYRPSLDALEGVPLCR